MPPVDFFLPSPPLRGRGVGGEGEEVPPPHPQPLSPEAGARGDNPMAAVSSRRDKCHDAATSVPQNGRQLSPVGSGGVVDPGRRAALPAEVGIARPTALPGMVSRRQIRHFHPLGRLLRAGLGQGGEYAEWYWNHIHDRKPDNVWWQFHKANYGETFDYQDFAPLFRAELFDADKWADIFARSGARYIVPTSKHHEGFCLWPSAEASRDLGPALERRRDRPAPRPDGRTGRGHAQARD